VPPTRRPRFAVATPAAADANNGNRRTAERWAGFLAEDADVRVHGPGDLDGLGDADALVALHAVKSRAAVERFRAARGAGAPVAVVLTGTDVYGSGTWRHGLESASALVVLQPAALARLDGALRAKARAIVQSAAPPPGPVVRGGDDADVVAVGHLRAVKDPHTLWRAARRLFGADGGAVAPAPPPFRIDHLGAALEPGLAEAARATEAACGGAFRWRGAVDHAATRHAIAAARLLVHPSVAEGGAHAVIEAVVSGTGVVASRIDGNTGLLGDDHPGLFEPGDDRALAALVRRAMEEPAFAAALAARSAALAPRFAPEAERAAVRALGRDLLAAAR
jgi:putative glycosyltransferase (TIGR04348 family)